MSIRQQIVDALSARLLTLSGYGGRVYPWRVTSLEPAELPAIVFRDTSAESSYEASAGNVRHTLSLDIEALHSAGSTTADSLRAALESLSGVIFSDPHLSEVTASDCYVVMTGHEINLEQQDRIVGAARLSLNIWYETTAGGI